MNKRIYAIVLLVGFILLLINLLVFRWQSAYFAGVYMVIVIFYMIFPHTQKAKIEAQDQNNDLQKQ